MDFLKKTFFKYKTINLYFYITILLIAISDMGKGQMSFSTKEFVIEQHPIFSNYSFISNFFGYYYQPMELKLFLLAICFAFIFSGIVFLIYFLLMSFFEKIFFIKLDNFISNSFFIIMFILFIYFYPFHLPFNENVIPS